MRTATAALVGALLLAALTACEPFYCPDEVIRATLDIPLVSGEDATSTTLSGNLESRVDRSEQLNEVQDAVEGESLDGRGVAIVLQRGSDHPLSISLWLPTPLRPGDVLTVVGAHSADRPFFWGAVINPPAGVSVAVKLDSFGATSATGSVRVLGLDPLRLDLDIQASGPSRQIPIDGVLTVRHDTQSGTCFE